MKGKYTPESHDYSDGFMDGRKQGWWDGFVGGILCGLLIATGLLVLITVLTIKNQ